MFDTNAIDLINNENLRNQINEIYEMENVSDEKKSIANDVAHWCYKLLENRGLIRDKNTHLVYVDILLMAALLHNVYVNDHNFYDVFKAREKLDPFLEEKGVPEEYRLPLFQSIEAQFGEMSAVPGVRPQPDTPQSILSTARFIVETLRNEAEKVL